MKFRLLSPSKPVADLEATSVSLPTFDGYIEVLPQHAPYVGALGIGALSVKSKEGTQEKYFVSGGFVEVSDGDVLILADTVERPGEIDVARAQQAESRAMERLTSKDPRLDVGRALVALEKAQQRSALARRQG